MKHTKFKQMLRTFSLEMDSLVPIVLVILSCVSLSVQIKGKLGKWAGKAELKVFHLCYPKNGGGENVYKISNFP
jgi:hypothetical protein